MIYFTLVLFLNKGYILNFEYINKYKKTGLNNTESKRVLRGLEDLLIREKVFKNNTISLPKLAKQLGISTHALSQIINENKQKTFYELLSYYRINEAKELLLKDSKGERISDVAYDVGYNSLSAFYNSFKKVTGRTPSQFKMDQEDEN